jgi:hypothetical protein
VIPRPAAPSAIIKFHAPEIVFGPGSLAEAGFAARRLGAERPFVVTDPGIIEAAGPRRCAATWPTSDCARRSGRS